MDDQQFEINEPAVVADEIDGMAVIINLETGAYYSGSGCSASAWAALVAGAPTTELATALSVPHPVVAAFAAHLLGEGLVRPRSGATQPWSVAPAHGPLTLDRFDDLEDLLLLDPVHDVTEQGWPHREG